MRKGIKIKAYTVLLAWMMIFSHSIIPHNHLNENNTGCHELVHNTNPTEDDCSGPLKFKSEPGDINVCHISNFLYHHFSEESLIYNSNITADNYTVCMTGSSLFNSEEPFIGDIYYGSASFRAPPSA